MSRLMWVVGLLLLAGSVVGAGWALNHANPPPGAAEKPVFEPPPEVVCLGVVDVEKGVTNLYPKQPGEVAWVAETKNKDGSDRVFKEGEVLLKLNTKMARLLVDKAKSAVKAAQADLEKAKKLPEELRLKLEAQEAAIRAYGHEKEKVAAELESKKKLLKENVGNVSPQILRMIEETLAATDERITVEKRKRDEIKLADPELEIRRADADLDAKQKDLDLAELNLQDYELRAPFEGTVLRVHTRVGELLGPSPKAPAIEFCPRAERVIRAEVIQEWGHRVRVGQEAVIEDDTYQGPTWQGRVKSLADFYGQKQMRIIEPFMQNDVRTMECIVEVTGGQSPLRIGQRMRVKIKI
jgi:HlyD family secretion protein